MDFTVGSTVIITDGRNASITRINGVRNGHLKVGSLLFDWCGNEVDTVRPNYKIYPYKDKKKEDTY